MRSRVATSSSAWPRASVAMIEAHEGGKRDASTRSDALRRCAQAGETRLDLFGARTLGKLLQVSAISVGCSVLFSHLLLGARQVEQEVFIVEIAGLQARERCLVTLYGLCRIPFGFPRIADTGSSERPEGRRRRSRRRDLVGRPGSCPVPLSEAHVTELVGTQRRYRGGRIACQRRLEASRRVGPCLRGGRRPGRAQLVDCLDI